MTLLEASKKDQIWRGYAFKITGDKCLADDIVQEMYLKLNKIQKKLNDFYIILMIRTTFYDFVRKNQNMLCYEDLDFLTDLNEKDTIKGFDIDDGQKKILDRYEKLPFHQKELIIENYDKSLRQIEKEFNINYGYIHRELKKARKTILKNGQKNERI